MSLYTISNMVEWIEANLMDHPTLTGLSRHVGYSPYYCSAKFRESVGVTFKQYISRRRVSMAADELRNSTCRLLDIAIKYGYSSQEAFTRAFVEAFGCTPLQCRKQKTLHLIQRLNHVQTKNGPVKFETKM